MPVSEEEYRDHMRSHHAFMNRLAEDQDDEEHEDDEDDEEEDDEEETTSKRKATPPPRKRKAGKATKAAKSRPSSYGNPRWFGHG